MTLTVLYLLTANGNFLSNVIIIVRRNSPIDIMYGFTFAVSVFNALTAIAQERINCLIAFVKITTSRCFFGKLGNRFIDTILVVSAGNKMLAQQVFTDVGVFCIPEITKIGISQFFNQPVLDSVLYFDFQIGCFCTCCHNCLLTITSGALFQ